MNNQTKNTMIGAFVIIAALLIVWVFTFLNPDIGDSGKTIRVRFTDLDKVNVGTRVHLAGRPVGEVIRIRNIQDARELPTDHFGQVFYYEVTISIDSRVQIFTSDEISIHTAGILGERTIAITPHAPQEGEAPVLVEENQLVYAKSIGSVTETLGSLANIVHKVEATFDGLNHLIDSSREDVKGSLRSLNVTIDQIRLSATRANDLDLVGAVTNAANSFQSTMKEATATMQELQDAQVPEHIGAVLENISTITAGLADEEQWSNILTSSDEFMSELKGLGPDFGKAISSFSSTMLAFGDTAKNLDRITTTVANGEGTAGKLLSSDDFYLRLTGFMDRVTLVVQDVNSYGLTFQNNKHWKRLRGKRSRQLKDLEHPAEFRRYFDRELGEITASLSRVGVLLDEMDESAEKRPNDEKGFSEAFAELLRRLDSMQGTLKLYNQELLQP